jgi:hypothetical protein
MQKHEAANANDNLSSGMIANNLLHEKSELHGRYHFKCFDKQGNLKWEEVIDNVVVTVGKNLVLDTILATAGTYTTVGPFMGLISSVSYTTGPVASDTMGSHGGWTEAGGTNAPTYTGTRKTAVFSAAAAGAKALSAALSFTMSGNGTIKGCFLLLGTGALNTIDNTAGTLYSAGTFAADRIMLSGDILNVSYSTSL